MNTFSSFMSPDMPEESSSLLADPFYCPRSMKVQAVAYHVQDEGGEIDLPWQLFFWQDRQPTQEGCSAYCLLGQRVDYKQVDGVQHPY